MTTTKKIYAVKNGFDGINVWSGDESDKYNEHIDFIGYKDMEAEAIERMKKKYPGVTLVDDNPFKKLKVGDIIVDSDGRYSKILAVLSYGEGEAYSVYAVSMSVYSIENEHELNKAHCIASSENLYEDGEASIAKSRKNWFKESLETFHKRELSEKEKEVNTLKKGDVVMCRDGNCMRVLAVLHNGEDGNTSVYLMSSPKYKDKKCKGWESDSGWVNTAYELYSSSCVKI